MKPEDKRLALLIRSHHYRAVKEGVLSTLTVEDWILCLEQHGRRCAYCGHAEGVDLEHVIPLTRGGDNVASNVVPACTTCNLKKGNRTPEEWAAGTKQPRPSRAQWQTRSGNAKVNTVTPLLETSSPRKRGRPAGVFTRIKSDETRLAKHSVRLTDAEWADCVATGNPSEFIRQAVKESLKNNP